MATARSTHPEARTGEGHAFCLGIFQLAEPVVTVGPVVPLRVRSGQVRKVTFQNFYKICPTPMSGRSRRSAPTGRNRKTGRETSSRSSVGICRKEYVTELMLIVSNSHPRQPIPAGHPSRACSSKTSAARFIEGWGRATLRLKDDVQDVTYVSSRATLRFKPRTVQDQQGNVQYDLMPTAVTWTVRHAPGCRLSGQAVVTIPAYLDQPLDPTRPAWGYLNVVGRRTAVTFTASISAVDPAARMTMTCPGDPPRVTQEPFGVAWVLHILSSRIRTTATQWCSRGGRPSIPRGSRTTSPSVRARRCRAFRLRRVPDTRDAAALKEAQALDRTPPRTAERWSTRSSGS